MGSFFFHPHQPTCVYSGTEILWRTGSYGLFFRSSIGVAVGKNEHKTNSFKEIHMNTRILAAMAFASIVSLTVATAGGNCGTGSTAKKSASGSCCSKTSTSTSTSTAKKDAKECTEEEGASCSTSKTAKAKKASMTSAGSCCSMKVKDVTSTSVVPSTEAASVTPATPQK